MHRLKIAALLIVLLAGTPAVAAERTLSVTDFDRLRVVGGYVVEVTTGRATSARIIGAQAAIEATSVDVQGHQMTIRRNGTAWVGYSGQTPAPPTIRITVPELTNISVSGPAKVSVDRLKGARVGAVLEGTGELLIAAVTADRTDLVSVGAGMLRIAGATADLTATVRGAGGFDAGALLAADAKLSSESAGQVTIAAKRSANVTMSGSGSVIVLGKPACTVKNTGSGTVICGASQKP